MRLRYSSPAAGKARSKSAHPLVARLALLNRLFGSAVASLACHLETLSASRNVHPSTTTLPPPLRCDITLSGDGRFVWMRTSQCLPGSFSRRVCSSSRLLKFLPCASPNRIVAALIPSRLSRSTPRRAHQSCNTSRMSSTSSTKPCVAAVSKIFTPRIAHLNRRRSAPSSGRVTACAITTIPGI